MSKKFKPSHVIDMATLTGAVVVALGTPATGVMGNDQPLLIKFLQLAKHLEIEHGNYLYGKSMLTALRQILQT